LQEVVFETAVWGNLIGGVVTALLLIDIIKKVKTIYYQDKKKKPRKGVGGNISCKRG